MPSGYPQIDVNYYQRGILIKALDEVTVKVYDATHNVDLDDLATNEAGILAAGTLAVDPGTTVRFRVENYLGASGAWETVTTELP